MKGPGSGPFLRVAIALAATVALLAGCAGTEDPTAGLDSPTPDATPPSDPSPADDGTETTPDPTPEATPEDEVLDPCLIGRWRQESMTSEVLFDEETLVVTGWTGRILEFRPDGTEVVGYDEATPREADAPQGLWTETWSGTAVYSVRTAGDLLVFDSVDFSDTTVSWEYADDSGTREPGPSAPVTYTCDETTHTQESERYQASFARIDSDASALRLPGGS